MSETIPKSWLIEEKNLFSGWRSYVNDYLEGKYSSLPWCAHAYVDELEDDTKSNLQFINQLGLLVFESQCGYLSESPFTLDEIDLEGRHKTLSITQLMEVTKVYYKQRAYLYGAVLKEDAKVLADSLHDLGYYVAVIHPDTESKSIYYQPKSQLENLSLSILHTNTDKEYLLDDKNYHPRSADSPNPYKYFKDTTYTDYAQLHLMGLIVISAHYGTSKLFSEVVSTLLKLRKSGQIRAEDLRS